ncbi:retrovirus-related pol polyprotein from transposon TNT 1-94 [Tanacetum coccineum]
MDNLNLFYQDIGPSSSAGRHLNQEEAAKEELAIRISQRYALLEEKRPVIETMAYNDKYKKILDEIWKDKVELDGKTVKEDEEAVKRIKGEALKEKDDPGAFIFPIRLEGKVNENALADTGSDINTMPYRIFETLGREDMKKWLVGDSFIRWVAYLTPQKEVSQPLMESVIKPFELRDSILQEHMTEKSDHHDPNTQDNTKQWKRYCFHKFTMSFCYEKDVTEMQSLGTTLVSCDGLGGYDWSDKAEEGPNYALMAFSSSSPNSKDQGVIDRGCSRHMTGNMSYLTDYEEIDGGYVAFVGNLKGGKITRKGKFDGKADEGFFVGYSLNSKAFKVFNSRTRIVEENLHIRFSKSTPNVVGSGPDWLFDINALTSTINYEPIVAGTQSNGFAGTKASDNAGQAKKETKPVKNYILLPLWTADSPFSHDPKNSQDDGSKPPSGDEKKVDEDSRKDSKGIDQEKRDNVNSTNNVNAASSNEVNAVGGKTSIELPFDPNMPELEDNSVFEDDEDVGAEADMYNLDTTIQEEPKKVIHALKDPSSIKAMQEELLQFKLQEVWTLVDLPYGKRAIGTKWVFRNKKDERGIVIRNKARLVAQGYMKEEGIDYDKIEEEVYVCQPPGFEDPNFLDRVYKVEKALYGLHQAPRAWYETLLTYILDIEFQREVKTASTPIETQKPLLKDEDGEEVDVHMYRSMIGSLMYLTSSRPGIMFAVYVCARYQVNPNVSHLHAIKRIFSDYAGASLDRKSTAGGCQFLGCRLISWQCEKQTVVANSTTEAEYMAASSCYRQVLWTQN